MAQPQSIAHYFISFLPPQNVLTDPQSLQFYGRDWVKDYVPNPTLVLLPETRDHVQKIIQICRQHRLAIVPSGGRTGLSGGATAANGEIVVSLERMRRIFEVNRIDRTLRCEAGTVLETVQREAENHDLLFPVDFSPRGSCQMGGAIATNAGGIRVVRYGNMRESVLGLVVVTGSGDLLELNGSLIKNNTGYDLRSLFIGSEGTLGIIVECTVRLVAKPGETIRALCGISKLDTILPLLTKTRDTFPTVSAFEFMERAPMEEVIKERALRDPLSDVYPYYILIELELTAPTETERFEGFLGTMLSDGTIADVVVAQSTAQSQEIMNLRDLIGETLAKRYTLHKNDISVPVPRITEFIAALRKTVTTANPLHNVVVFGHVGDGNLHVNTLKMASCSDQEFWDTCKTVDNEIFKLVQSYDGSISAEHGVGLLKKDFLHLSRTAAEIELMRGIKRVFDPDGIMNPGKVLP